MSKPENHDPGPEDDYYLLDNQSNRPDRSGALKSWTRRDTRIVIVCTREQFDAWNEDGRLPNSDVIDVSKLEDSADHQLVIKLDIPAGASDDEVIEKAKAIALAINEQHKLLGGHGLQVDSLEIFQPSISGVRTDG